MLLYLISFAAGVAVTLIAVLMLHRRRPVPGELQLPETLPWWKVWRRRP